MSERPQNFCRSCGYTWYPKGSDLSLRCPHCKSPATAIVPPAEGVNEGGCLKGCLTVGLGLSFLLVLTCGVFTQLPNIHKDGNPNNTTDPDIRDAGKDTDTKKLRPSPVDAAEGFVEMGSIRVKVITAVMGQPLKENDNPALGRFEERVLGLYLEMKNTSKNDYLHSTLTPFRGDQQPRPTDVKLIDSDGAAYPVIGVAKTAKETIGPLGNSGEVLFFLHPSVTASYFDLTVPAIAFPDAKHDRVLRIHKGMIKKKSSDGDLPQLPSRKDKSKETSTKPPATYLNPETMNIGDVGRFHPQIELEGLLVRDIIPTTAILVGVEKNTSPFILKTGNSSNHFLGERIHPKGWYKVTKTYTWYGRQRKVVESTQEPKS